MIEWGRPRMGVDLCTETDLQEVPHCYTTEVPSYTLEVCKKDTWVVFSDVPVESLHDVVESMHLDYDCPVRLKENGYVVFTVWP